MRPLQVAGLVLLILGIIGFVSGTAPLWSRAVVLVLGVILLIAGRARKS